VYLSKAEINEWYTESIDLLTAATGYIYIQYPWIKCINMQYPCFKCTRGEYQYVPMLGRIQDFKLGGWAGGSKFFGVFRVKNHDFTPKNHIFSNFRGARAGCGGGTGAPPPPPPPRTCLCTRGNRCQGPFTCCR
jgi:hypothetical protein